MAFISIAVISALCLVFPSTRIYALMGTGLLLYFQPYATLGLLLVAGIAFYFIHKHQRRKPNAL